mmetsp:Transcript_23876/g.42530  ORF Transcript_23876/g.42530 Transcript_23876/m.42530 type:complete len:224 (+) Transcript_23876:87-758(+)
MSLKPSMIRPASNALAALQLIATLFGPSMMKASSAVSGSKLSRNTFEPAKCFASGSGSVARRMPQSESLYVSQSPSLNSTPWFSKNIFVQSSSLLRVRVIGIDDTEYFLINIPFNRCSFMSDMVASSSSFPSFRGLNSIEESWVDFESTLGIPAPAARLPAFQSFCNRSGSFGAMSSENMSRPSGRQWLADIHGGANAVVSASGPCHMRQHHPRTAAVAAPPR